MIGAIFKLCLGMLVSLATLVVGYWVLVYLALAIIGLMQGN